MKLLPLLLVAAALTGCATTETATAPPAAAPPLLVADRLYWAGEEGNLAATLTGKFHRLADLAAELNPALGVGEFRGVPVRLFNILVSADYNANGLVATWTVSGPQPLIAGYLKRLRALAATPGVLSDFSADTVAAAPTAAFERAED